MEVVVLIFSGICNWDKQLQIGNVTPPERQHNYDYKVTKYYNSLHQSACYACMCEKDGTVIDKDEHKWYTKEEQVVDNLIVSLDRELHNEVVCSTNESLCKQMGHGAPIDVSINLAVCSFLVWIKVPSAKE